VLTTNPSRVILHIVLTTNLSRVILHIVSLTRRLLQTDYPTPPREPTTFRELFFSVLTTNLSRVTYTLCSPPIHLKHSTHCAHHQFIKALTHCAHHQFIKALTHCAHHQFIKALYTLCSPLIRYSHCQRGGRKTLGDALSS
jgi:hypothetical protein